MKLNMHDSVIFECHYAECRFLFGVMPSVIMLSVIMLSVIKLNVVVPASVAKIKFGTNSLECGVMVSVVFYVVLY
jgi:hypothetical protein